MPVSAFPNCCQLRMKSIQILIATQQLKQGEFFLIFRKPLIKSGVKGLIYKLKIYGIDSDLLKLLINYLEDQKERVVLNGQTSFWKNILARGSHFIPNLHKWFTWWNKVNIPNSFRWHIAVQVKDKNCTTVDLNNDLET